MQFQLFSEFLNSVKHEDDFFSIVLKYEVPLKGFLENYGFRSAAFISHIKSPHQYPLKTMKLGMPLVKKKTFFQYEHCLDNIILVFYQIRQQSAKDYTEILDYFQHSAIWLTFQLHRFEIMNFLYRKKIKKDGRMIIKICKIPVTNFLYRKKITKDGKLIVKICKIPVFRKRIDAKGVK
jgi:hypothetical protein